MFLRIFLFLFLFITIKEKVQEKEKEQCLNEQSNKFIFSNPPTHTGFFFVCPKEEMNEEVIMTITETTRKEKKEFTHFI
jgi:hypothetical protein